MTTVAEYKSLTLHCLAIFFLSTFNFPSSLSQNSGFIVRFQKHILLREQREAAAIQIQAIYRGQLGRFHAMDLRIIQKQNALILLQCAWRMTLARNKVHQLRTHKEKIHAIKMQAWWRGTYVKYVLDPNPIQSIKLRLAQQRAAMRKHVSTIAAKKAAIKKLKLLKKRMKLSKARGLITSSRRSRSREGGRRKRKGGRSSSPGRNRRGGKLRAPKPVNAKPIDPVVLLKDALLYHAVNGSRDIKMVSKIFNPNVPYVINKKEIQNMEENEKNEDTPDVIVRGGLPMDQEVASFIRISFIHALSSQSTSDVVGDALASLLDISLHMKHAQKNKPLEIMDTSQKRNSPNRNSPNRNSSNRNSSHRRSPKKKKIKIPQMAYSNILRDYYHANVLYHPDDLEGMRHLLAALMVGIETLWTDPFECGIAVEQQNNNQQNNAFKNRLTRISVRLIKGAKEAVAFRKQSRINAMRAAAAEDSNDDSNDDNEGEDKYGNNTDASNHSSAAVATPRGTEESKEDKQLRQSHLIVDLLNHWFFESLIKISNVSVIDAETNIAIHVYQRGDWIVVKGTMLNTTENENEITELAITEKGGEEDRNGNENEKAMKKTNPIYRDTKSYVFSKQEAKLTFGINSTDIACMNNQEKENISHRILKQVKLLRNSDNAQPTVFQDDVANEKEQHNTSNDLDQQNINLASNFRVVVLPIERHRAFLRYTRKRKAAAIVVQRCYKGRRLLNAMQRRVALYQRGHANHKMKLDKILAKHEASQKHHIALVDMVKAAFIARRQRKQLRNLHYMAKKIQVIMRVYLQWLREEERKAWEKYGAQVRTVYDRCRIVSGKAMVVRVQRAGKNWMLRGIDHSVGEVYQGMVKEQQLNVLIKRYPHGADQGYSIKRRKRLYSWEHPRVLLLLLKCLAVTDAIDGLGELNGFDGKRIMICHEEFGNKAEGPSILSRLGQGRLLPDTKDCIPKDPTAAPEEF